MLCKVLSDKSSILASKKDHRSHKDISPRYLTHRVLHRGTLCCPFHGVLQALSYSVKFFILNLELSSWIIQQVSKIELETPF